MDVRTCTLLYLLPYQFPNRTDCQFSMDERGNHLALVADGKV